MDTAEQERRLLTVIWSAIMLSLVIYAFAGWYALRLPREGTSRPWQEWLREPLIMVLYMLGVALFFASLIVPKYILLSQRRAGASGGSPVRQALVVRWALAESIAIFGLVAAFISGHLELMIPLWLVAMIAVVMAYPSDATITAMEER